ncbi:alpha-(1-_3)-arabinofuranosyltransferase domain-containing protein [Blastococcus litoris]|uniref:alpha-(1->3)-arabinofuranosyltransferase domain-containing protein n=1 Tax=Blastococcus litoris TaxID=2171622 RepID=UPI000E309ADF|nr:alpha-(1->3)-arabinofuranosyltransferase family protein [Blastococcus litoris]
MTASLTRTAGADPAPAVPAAPPPPGDPGQDGGWSARLLHRLRLGAVLLAFLGLSLNQQPGQIVADTKLDLAVDPSGFLGRALLLWEPEGFAGQVQNQAYGYLFPMGPFFGLGNAMGIPTWVVQRLWWTALFAVAFLGVMALARRLELGTDATRIVGALAYALAPRMVSGIGLTSVEMIPMALAPWVLVPLVSGARTGSPRRAAALSGVAVFCVGGVNAVATAAVLPLAALWLLTLPGGPRKRRLIGWWVVSVGLATAWWVGPLLLLGRFSPDFLDYIETAATTTGGNELVQVLRGTTQWVAGLGGPYGPTWPAGWDLLHEVLPVAGTVVVATAGLVGLLRRDLPHRRWLVLGLLAGVVLVSAGHVAAVEGAGAGAIRELLDSALAPLRNLHKFDPVLRLPLVLGMVHLLGVLLAAATRRRDRDRPPGPPPAPRGRRRSSAVRLACATLVGLVLAGVAAAAQPAVDGRLVPPTGFQDIPGYWRETAAWLAADDAAGRALLVPASSFGTYLWGSTGDEPMQPLADSPWDVRNAIPLTPTGHIRALDAVEERLGRGEGSEALTRFLARSGYSHVVVRNDLDAPAAKTSRLALVHQALASSPGIERVAAFGPELFGGNGLSGTVTDGRADSPVPAVEVFAVPDVAPTAYTVPVADAVEVVGGPDGVLALEEHGLLHDRPAVIAGDGAVAGGGTLVSDALQRRERTTGAITAAASAGLTADDPLRLGRPARDYLLDDHAANESVVRIGGARVTASSSGADADNSQGVRPGEHPFAAVDGDPATAWRPAPQDGPVRAWWEVELARPFAEGAVTVVLDEATASDPPARLRVVTDEGSSVVRLQEGARVVRIELPEGETRTLRLVAEPRTGSDQLTFGLAEVRLPGADVSRTVDLPSVAAGGRAVEGFAFDAANPAAYGCVTDADGRPRCQPSLVAAAEEPLGLARTFTVPSSDSYGMSVSVRPRPGAELDGLVASAAGGLRAEVNGSLVPDPRAGAWAAVDGDPDTAWLAEPGTRESLTVSWSEPRRISEVRLRYTEGTAASRPVVVTVRAGDVERLVQLDRRGVATFPGVVTDTVTVDFSTRAKLSSIDTYGGTRTELGVGVSELEVRGVEPLDLTAPVEVPCGEGPEVVVDGVRHQTSVRATVGDLLALAPVRLTFCSGSGSTAGLLAGRHTFVAESTSAFTVESATLDAGVASSGAQTRDPVQVQRWDPEHRALQVDARTASTLLVVPENVNAGWRATLQGRELEAVQVDGWQQGYVLPAGAAGVVRLDFAPGDLYRGALVAGGVALLLLAALARFPVRGSAGEHPPVGRPGRRSGVVTVGAAAVLLVLLGGYWALLALLGVGALAALVPTRQRVLTVVAALALVAAGALLAAGPGMEPVRQVLALTALAALVVSLVSSSGSWALSRRGPRRRDA